MSRDKLVKIFIDSGCDTLFFLDNDVSWNPEDALRLIENDRDDIVAGIYPFKKEEEDYPVVIHTDENGYPTVRQDGLIHAAMIPFGFVRIKRNVIEKLIIANPDKKFVLNETGKEETYYDLFPQGLEDGRWWGEDYAFCRLWNKIGGEIYVEPNIWLKHHYGVDFKEFKQGNYHEYLMKRPK